MASESVTLAAVILTRNEALDIAGCVRSCSFADAVFVFDSYSTDETVGIARSLGATVHQRVFTNYAEQRNAAIAVASGYNWILMVDADERIPEALAKEIRARIKECSPRTTMFSVRRKDYFQGRWLRRSSGYPTWFRRLFRPGSVRFTREVNELAETVGANECLTQHFEHYPFSKGLAYWIERHNRYSSMEAVRLVAEESEAIPWLCNWLDPFQRRCLMKRIFYRLPFRPAIAFWGLYLLRGGFLDGRPGLHYCRLRAMYETMIDLKRVEAKRLGREDST